MEEFAEMCKAMEGEFIDGKSFNICKIDGTDVWVRKDMKNPFTTFKVRNPSDITFFRTTKIEYDEKDEELAVRRGIARAFVDKVGGVRVNID